MQRAMDRLISKIEDTRRAVRDAEDQLARNDEAMRLAAHKYSEAEQYLEKLKTELESLELADRLRPMAGSKSEDAAAGEDRDANLEKRRGGRKPGSISKKWREALADLVTAGNGPVDSQQFYLLTRGRLGLTEGSVRERIRQYVAQGILSEAGGKISVSRYSIQKWDLDESYPRDAGAAENKTAPH